MAISLAAGTTITGPVPAGAADNTAVTVSIWLDAGISAGGEGVWIAGSSGMGVHGDYFEFIAEGVDNIASFLYRNDPDYPNVSGTQFSFPPITGGGSVNVLLSLDTVAGIASYALCGPASEISSNAPDFINIFNTNIPFLPVPNWYINSPNAIYQFDWATLIIGAYYDFTIEANRRLFNGVCPLGSGYLPRDPSTLGPSLLMQGNVATFLTNRADASAWTVGAGSINNAPDIVCPAIIGGAAPNVPGIAPGPNPGPGASALPPLGIVRRGTLNFRRSLTWGQGTPWAGLNSGRGIGYTFIQAFPFRPLPASIRTSNIG